VKTKLFLDSIDAWMFAQKSLVNAKRKSVLPVVTQRQRMTDSPRKVHDPARARAKAKKTPDLTGYLASQDGGKDGQSSAAGAKPGPQPQPTAVAAVTNGSVSLSSDRSWRKSPTYDTRRDARPAQALGGRSQRAGFIPLTKQAPRGARLPAEPARLKA
jgi:hypothetical protein